MFRVPLNVSTFESILNTLQRLNTAVPAALVTTFAFPTYAVGAVLGLEHSQSRDQDVKIYVSSCGVALWSPQIKSFIFCILIYGLRREETASF